MSKRLDSEEIQRAFLSYVAAGEGLRPACKAVGVSRTTLARYMDAHPDFKALVDQAKLGVPPPAVIPRPLPPDPPLVPAALAEVVNLPRKGKPKPDKPRPSIDAPPAPWADDLEALRDVAAKMWLDRCEEPAVRNTCAKYLFARSLQQAAAEPNGDYVTVDLPPKEELAEV